MRRAPVLTSDALGREYPECKPWLALLEEAQRAMADPHWASVDVTTPAAPPTENGSPVPRLDGAVLRIDEAVAEDFVRRLLTIAAREGGPPSLLDAARSAGRRARGLLEAAACHDAGRLDRWAGDLGVPVPVLRAVAGVAVAPLLHAFRRSVGEESVPGWTRGYCPICGAWPAMAEARGLERSRRLRCARCGGDWRIDWLRCPYCFNTDHGTLGSLVAEATLEARSIDTCLACRGYLKTLTVLQPTPTDVISLVDVATIDLDVAALAHGYERPAEPAQALSARLVAAGR